VNTIDRLKALENAATSGPWLVFDPMDGIWLGENTWFIAVHDAFGTHKEGDFPFIAAARNAIGPLLKVAEAAKAYHDMATSRYDSSRVAEFERKQDALGEAIAELEAQ